MINLKKIAFIVALLGIAILLGLLFFSDYKVVSNSEELDGLEINSKVKVVGKVGSERIAGEDFKILRMEGFDFDITCDCCGEDLLDKEVEINGIVSEYEGQKQVEALVVELVSEK